jgi:nucleoside phosphorylase
MNQDVQWDRDSSGKRRQDDTGSGISNDGDAGVSMLAKRPKTSSFTHQPAGESCRPDPSPPIGLTASSYTVAWICALPCELAAAMAMLDEEHPYPQDQSEDDSNHYTLGSIGGHNVAIACLPTTQYGNVSATNVLTNLRRTFQSIRACLMVGVGAGVPGRGADIRLGDVVVGVRVMPYELGKVGVGGQIQQTNSWLMPGLSLGNLLSTIRAKHERAPSRVPSIIRDRFPPQLGYTRPDQPDRLFSASYEHVEMSVSEEGEQGDGSHSDQHVETGVLDPCEKCDGSKVLQRPARNSTTPHIHYGAIGSGDKLMKNGKERDDQARKLDVICFEMEAAGLMSVMPCLPIRGICDYADSHKNKNWQRYAAAIASAYARELLETMPVAHRGPSRTQGIKSSQEVDPRKFASYFLSPLC